MMIIKLSQLKEGSHEFYGKDEISTIGLDDEIFLGDVSTKVIVDKRGQNYYIKIFSNVMGKFCCDRCLETFSKKINSDSMIIYTEDKTLIDSSDDKNEIRYLRPEDADFNLSEDIRQFLLLNVPVKLLCGDECKGLCPNCGKNMNIEECKCKKEFNDPRWEKLKKLKLSK